VIIFPVTSTKLLWMMKIMIDIIHVEHITGLSRIWFVTSLIQQTWLQLFIHAYLTYETSNSRLSSMCPKIGGARCLRNDKPSFIVELVMSQIKSLRVQWCVLHVLYLSWFSSFTIILYSLQEKLSQLFYALPNLFNKTFSLIYFCGITSTKQWWELS
jgi:hypothetical protein